MAPCLSKFPSLCLESIFKHVPLSDLLYSLGLVCTSWYNSRRTELMRRKRLVIVQREEQLEKPYDKSILCSHETDLIRHVRRDDGSPWLSLESLDHIKFDALAVPNGMLTNQFVSSLLNLSNITHLTLMFNPVPSSSLPQVICLIDNFSKHLVDLKLSFIYFSDNDDDSEYEGNVVVNEDELFNNQLFLTNLFACLDRLQTLQHLRLLLQFPNLSIRPQLSFLSRLTTFSIFIYNAQLVDWIFASLLQYGGNVGSIELHNDLELQDLLPVGRQIGHKFTALTIDLSQNHAQNDLTRFCTRFTSLTILEICDLSMLITMLARCLSQLLQLVHLDLDIPDPQIEETRREEGKGEIGLQNEIAQVRSVRLLTLFFRTKTHHDSERLFISEIFPNLQVLGLTHRVSECSDCAIRPLRFESHDIENSEPELAIRLIECSRLTRQPFRRCANLHTIALGGKETLINVNEL